MKGKFVEHIERESNGRFVKGHLVSKENRIKFSLLNKGKHYSPATEFKKGNLVKHSKETKEKISKSNKKRFKEYPELKDKRSEQTKRLMKEGKIKGFLKGEENVAKRPEIRKILSEKTKEQMRFHPTKGMLGKHQSEETKKNISINNKGKKPWNIGIPMREETKEKLFKINFGKKCSTETIEKMRKIHVGEKSHLWKGGITEINLLLRKRSIYKIWREQVFLRDNFTCQNKNCKYCNNKIGVLLNAHHIKSFSIYPELRYDVDNGITYCKEFHNLFRKELHSELFNKMRLNK